MLTLTDQWVWDFWTADDGERYHLFFLKAPRSLGDPDLRHRNARVGHAVSHDLRSWTLLPDVLVPSPAPACDDLAIWTGCVVRPDDGPWHMFYTGTTEVDGALVQSTCLATSTDLTTWTRHPDNPVLRADPRWYDTRGEGWPDEHWRDPWVRPDPDGDGWQVLVTARGRTGPLDDRGVIGHGWSPDLVHWEPRPPLSAPGAGFGQLEVMQTEVIDGRAVLLFSCLAGDLSAAHRRREPTGGIWAVTAPDDRAEFDVRTARRIADDRLYVGRMVRDRAGRWVLLAFHNRGADGTFVGSISDPIPLAMTRHGLAIADDAAAA